MAMEFLGALLWGTSMESAVPEHVTLFKEAMAFAQKGQLTEAADKLLLSIRLDDEWNIRQRAAMLAQFLNQLSRFEEILELTDKFVEEIPELMIARASAFKKLQCPEEAAECYSKALALSSIDPALLKIILNEYAQILESLERWDALKQISEELMGKQPNTTTFHHYYLLSLFYLNEMEMASKHVESIKEEHGDSPSFQFVLGRFYQKCDQHDDAESAFQSAARSDPKNQEFQMFYFQSLLQRGRQNEISKHCEFLIDRDPDSAHWIGMIGFMLFESADYESAAKHFEKCIDLIPDEPGYVTDYAMALCEVPGQLGSAKEVMTDIIQKYPDNVPVQYRMARVLQLESTSNYPEAEDLYLEILSKEPQRRRVNMGYAHLLHAMGRYKESMKYFQISSKLDGANPYYHYWRGLLLIDDHYKRYQEGIQSFERCLEIKPFFHFSHYEMARVYCDVIGNKRMALQHMEKAVSIHCKSEEYKKELERMREKEDWKEIQEKEEEDEEEEDWEEEAKTN